MKVSATDPVKSIYLPSSTSWRFFPRTSLSTLQLVECGAVYASRTILLMRVGEKAH